MRSWEPRELVDADRMALTDTQVRTFAAISVQQPWAWAIVRGLKDVENRSWWTRYRGSLMIHASKKERPGGFAELREPLWAELHKRFQLAHNRLTAPAIDATALLERWEETYLQERELGAVVGTCQLSDCVRVGTSAADAVERHSPWFYGPCGLVLRDAAPCAPLPMTGRLGIWKVPGD